MDKQSRQGFLKRFIRVNFAIFLFALALALFATGIILLVLRLTTDLVEKWPAMGAWDRARGHHGDAYDGIEVERVFQPPYSPELNPAERIFEYLRDKIEGFVYGSIANKKAAVERELEVLALDPERVKSLAGWSWIRDAVSSLA